MDDRLDPLTISGRGFHGLRLQAPITIGPISLRAQRAWSWTEPGIEQASGYLSQPTRRVLLSGDCIIEIGGYEFQAARASLFFSRLEPDDADAGEHVWQIFLVLDRVSSSAEAAATAFSADRLSVQAVVRASEGISLRSDLPPAAGPIEDDFVRESERRLAQHLRRTVLGIPEIPGVDIEPIVDRRGPIPPLEPGVDRPFEAGEIDPIRLQQEASRELPPADRPEPIFAKEGVVTFDAGEVRGEIKDGERVIILSKGVAVQYWDRSRNRTLELTAQRAVFFAEPTPIAELREFDVSQVHGIYLEGDVIADDGQFTLRSPRVYYDVQNNKGVMADAVFSTFDARYGIPLYIRAKTMEQESRETFKATQARLSNTAFFEPEITLGASSITVTSVQRENAAGVLEPRTIVDARGLTIRAFDVPFFYFPVLKGDPSRVALEEIRVENSNSSGTAVKASWNLWTLLGQESRDDLRVNLLTDWFFDRGLALGLDVEWSGRYGEGGILAYGLTGDNGRDTLSSGSKKDFDGDFRGLILGEHRANLGDGWTLFAEAAQISDPTFIDGFFDSLSRNRREFTNSVLLRRTRDNTVLTAQAKGTFDDFLANEFLLQSQGYVVDKTPELSYTRLADPLFAGLDAAGISYSSEYRATRMKMSFAEPKPGEIGYANAQRAQSTFGVGPNQSIADGLRARGFNESGVNRFDTRHEALAKLQAGPITLNPFIVGRVTAYDTDFEDFSPSKDDSVRLWGSTGVRASTSFVRIDDAVESPLFDLHRIRHIIEPSATVWAAGTNLEQGDLPTYDSRVESIADGSAVALGLDQTWQTQRGGPGRWRSVDVAKLNGRWVQSSSDAPRDSAYGRWFDARPEYSNFGDFLTIDFTWQASEVVSIGINEIFDFETRQSARTSLGGTIQHAPDFSSYGELTFLNPENQTYFFFGTQYQLTKKYGLSLNAAYDTDRGDFQTISAELRRRSQSTVLGLGLSYNNITGETSFGLTIRPWGFGQSFGGPGLVSGGEGRSSQLGG
jgi:LPS transport system D